MRNKTLDFVKLFSAYAVVFIHFRLPGIPGAFVDALARFAVPLFFLISGYYASGNNDVKLKRKAINIGKLYLFATAFYTIFTFIFKSVQGGILNGVRFAVDIFNVRNIVKFFLFNRTISSEHLWFLPALLYCYLLFRFLNKKRVRLKSLGIFALVLMTANLMLGEFSGLLGIRLISCVTRNFLFTGFPFFAFGLLIRKHEQAILRYCNQNITTTLLIIGVVETIMSRLFLGRYELYIGSILITFVIFAWALKLKEMYYPSWMESLMACNTYIYIFHMFIGRMLKAGIVGVCSSDSLQVFMMFCLPAVTAVLTTLFALLILKIKKKGERHAG